MSGAAARGHRPAAAACAMFKGLDAAGRAAAAQPLPGELRTPRGGGVPPAPAPRASREEPPCRGDAPRRPAPTLRDSPPRPRPGPAAPRPWARSSPPPLPRTFSHDRGGAARRPGAPRGRAAPTVPEELPRRKQTLRRETPRSPPQPHWLNRVPINASAPPIGAQSRTPPSPCHTGWWQLLGTGFKCAFPGS